MNVAGLPGGPAPVGGQYSTLFRKPNAHADSIWSVAWKRQAPATKNSLPNDVIVSGGVDDTVKVCKILMHLLQLSSAAACLSLIMSRYYGTKINGYPYTMLLLHNAH